LQHFQVIVSGDGVQRGKPFPDPYLAAAQALQIPIGECVVVENAPVGIISAKAAGAYCVAIASTLPQEKLRGADEVIGSFSELSHVAVVQQLLE
jgi:beta-phosphoglucomutase